NLDFQHTIFGQLVRGQAFLNTLGSVPVTSNGSGENSKPVNPPVIMRASIIDDPNDTVVLLKAAAGTTSGTATITVRAVNSAGEAGTQAFTANATADQASNNTPPILGPIGDQVTPVNTPAVFTLSGSDLEGDALVFAAQVAAGSPGTATVSVNG